ncbi:hypothetical protein ADK57_40585 [Streptomyces sp. MMG1533]|nr:hypothetical protein ADK57_40585 [Streptomyces sp. MMG1533]
MPRLTATGLTNRQIGREQLLSVKTIENHLGHVCAKLGVLCRATLAAVLLETAGAAQRTSW